MGRGTAAFVCVGMLLGTVGVGLQWLVPLFEKYVLHRESVSVPGAHGCVYFALLAPLLAALLLCAWAARAAAFAAARSARRAARARAGPPAFVPFTDLSAADEVERLHAAFGAGISRPVGWRRRQLLALVDMIDEHQGDICRAIAQDLHKSEVEALTNELLLVRHELCWLADNVARLASPKRVTSSASVMPSRSFIHKDPLGVVFVIGTWNFPFGLSVLPLAGSIAGGNCTICKFSPAGTHFGPLMCSLLPKFLDMRCFALEWSGEAETVQAVLAQPLDLVFYTGSERVGKIIYATAARQLCPCVLELGGMNPVIVDRTADFAEAASRIAWGKLTNSGQVCIAPDYVLCVSGDGGNVAGRLIEELRKRITSMFGATAEEIKRSPFYGRMINSSSVERLAGMIEANRDRVVFGGDYDAAERFVSPTLIFDPPVDSPTLMRDEIFGPVLPIINVPTLDDALRIANSHGKPLALYVFSTNKAFQDRVLRETRSGGAVVNDTVLHYSNSHLPFGGVGSSGIGNYHGKWTFKSFVHERAVIRANRLSNLVTYFRLPPFTPFKRRVFLGIIRHCTW